VSYTQISESPYSSITLGAERRSPNTCRSDTWYEI